MCNIDQDDIIKLAKDCHVLGGYEGEWQPLVDFFRAAQAAERGGETPPHVAAAEPVAWQRVYDRLNEVYGDCGTLKPPSHTAKHYRPLYATPPATQERKCVTCKHFKQGKNPLVGVYDIDCFECKHYYASKWDAA